MNRSTFKKIIALTLIWGMLANICLLNAMQLLPAQADSIKNSPRKPNDAVYTISDDGATVDSSLIELLSVSRAKCVDSALTRLLKISKNERFSITMVNGDTYTGKIRLRDNGVEIRRKKYEKKLKFEKQIISWSEIKQIKLLVPTPCKKNIALIYLIIVPVSIAALWFGGAPGCWSW